MKPVFIKWYDAVSDDDWVDGIDKLDLTPHLIHTFGFLLLDTDNYIMVALNLDMERAGASQRLSIPKGWIKELHYYPSIGQVDEI